MRLKNFLDYSDEKPLLKYINDTSLEDFEFFGDLKHVYQMVSEINSRLSKDSSLVFDILGPEQQLGLHNKATREEHSRWFVNERDKVSAANIIEYSKSNPDQKILVFYGQGHFTRELVDKGFGSEVIPKSERMGYMLGHNLSEHFGKASVLTVAQ